MRPTICLAVLYAHKEPRLAAHSHSLRFHFRDHWYFVLAFGLTMAVVSPLYSQTTGGLVSLAPLTTPATSHIGFTFPDTAIAGGNAFTLSVSGSGFISGAVVSWNGAPLTTT